MADDDIIQTIALEGEDDVVAGLAAIGKAGEAMFSSLTGAADSIGSSLGSAFDEVSDVAGQAFDKVRSSAESAFSSLGDAAEPLTGAFSQAFQKISSQGEAAFQKLASAGGPVASQLGSTVTSAFNQITESIGPVGIALGTTAAAFAGLGAAAFEWAKASSESVHATETLAQEMGASIEEVSALQGALVELGGSADRMASAMQRAGSVVQRTWDEVQKDVAGAADKIEEDSIKVAKAQQAAIGKSGLDAREAALTLKKAKEEQQKDQESSPDRLKSAVNDVISGVKTLAEAGKEANLSVGNLMKGLILNTEGAAEALKSFSGNISDLSSQGPKVEEVMLKLADVMKNSGNATANMALLTRLFGRSMATDLIGPLSQGSAAIKEHEDRLKSLGMVYDDAAQKVSGQFNAALQQLAHDLQITAAQMGIKLDPAFISGMQDLSKYIEDNHGKLMAWADDMANKITPYINGFFDSLKGLAAYLAGDALDPSSTAGKWEETWRKMAEVVKAVAAVVVTAVDIIGGAIGKLGIGTGGLDSVLEGMLLLGTAKFAMMGLKWGAALLASFTSAIGGLGKLLGLGGAAVEGAGAAGAAGVAGAGAAGAGAAGAAEVGGIGLMEGLGLGAAGAAVGGIGMGGLALSAVIALVAVAVIDKLMGGDKAKPGAQAPDDLKKSADLKQSIDDQVNKGIDPRGPRFGPQRLPPSSKDTAPVKAADTTAPVKAADDSAKLPESASQTSSAFDTLKSALSSAAAAVVAFGDKMHGASDQPATTAASDALQKIAPPAQSAADGLTAIQQPAQSSAGALAQLGPAATQAAEALAKLGQSSTPSGHASGGLIGGHGSGTSDSNLIRASRGEFVVTASGSNLGDAIAHFTRGFAGGGLVTSFTNAVASIPGYASGGVVSKTGSNALGFHQLDIRTNAGSFSANVSEDTMQGIRTSALSGKLSQTGQRPSWFS